MTLEVLALEGEPARSSRLSEYCAVRGFKARVVADFAEFAAHWHPGLRMSCLSVPPSRTDSIDAIRFLAERRCDAGLILTSDADPRILSAACG